MVYLILDVYTLRCSGLPAGSLNPSYTRAQSTSNRNSVVSYFWGEGDTTDCGYENLVERVCASKLPAASCRRGNRRRR